jgi:hypothetical protein
LVDAADSAANNTLDILGNNRGTTPDVGAWDINPAAPMPTGTVTNITVTGTTVTVTGTTTNTPTSGLASITPTSAAYNAGVAQSAVPITLGSGTFTVTFSNVKVGQYALSTTFTNAAGPNAGTNALGNINVTSASGTVQSQVLDGQVLTISGNTTGSPTSVSMLVPSLASNPNGATSAGPVQGTITGATYSVSATLIPGNYDVPVVQFTNADGTSLPIAGPTAVSVVSISGSPQAPPGDGSGSGSGTPTVSSVTVSPATATGSTTFTAVVNGTNSPAQGVTWSATGGTINGGVFTAPAATQSVQTITVTATSVQDPTKSGTATVTIAAAVVTPPPPGSRVTTLILGDASGPAANLSGIKVAVFDEPTPDLRNAPKYKTASASTDSNGMLSLTFPSALNAGQSCGVSVQLADGRNFDIANPVT